MIYVESNSTDPYFNFALEQYLMSEKQFPNETVFMFWRTTPTLMVGNYQNTYKEINQNYVEKNNILVVRRMSGGGTIYTDMGGWQFSFIEKESHTEIGFKKYIEPVVFALQKMGVPATFNGRNDLVIDGKKFSGNAQLKRKGYTLHHGSILFETNIDEMIKSTTVDEAKMLSKGIASVRERVTNISEHIRPRLSILEFKQLMISSIMQGSAKTYALIEPEVIRVQQIAMEQFNNWQSIYGKSPKFSLIKSKRFAGGSVECHLDVEKGKILDLKIYGDFFGTLDMNALCAALKGCEYHKESIYRTLVQSNLSGSLYQIGLQDITDAMI